MHKGVRLSSICGTRKKRWYLLWISPKQIWCWYELSHDRHYSRSIRNIYKKKWYIYCRVFSARRPYRPIKAWVRVRNRRVASCPKTLLDACTTRRKHNISFFHAVSHLLILHALHTGGSLDLVHRFPCLDFPSVGEFLRVMNVEAHAAHCGMTNMTIIMKNAVFLPNSASPPLALALHSYYRTFDRWCSTRRSHTSRVGWIPNREEKLSPKWRCV